MEPGPKGPGKSGLLWRPRWRGRASMEPGPKGPGKPSLPTGRRRADGLQWSPDQKARERRQRCLPTKRVAMGFNGARTKRPGKGRSRRFAGTNSGRASMEPGPKGPGKASGKTLLAAVAIASMEPGPKGPGKWMQGWTPSERCSGFNGARTKRPGKVFEARRRSYTSRLLQWSPDQKARERRRRLDREGSGRLLQWSPDQKARERRPPDDLFVAPAVLQWSPDQKARERTTIPARLNLAPRLQWSPDQKARESDQIETIFGLELALQWSPDQKARESPITQA